MYKLFTALCLVAILCTQCNTPNPVKAIAKTFPNDPFKNVMTPSQYFDIDGKIGQVIEGKNGTRIVCPEGCFVNAKGKKVLSAIKVELAEALAVDEMILSNLTTTSEGKMLETDGMIYLNATANGEQLAINKDIPVYIEIPTKDKKDGMMVYKGIRDSLGNMNWVEPKELDRFLIPVALSQLDFLPEGFKAGVENGMPFRNYKEATPELTDSLYYSLSENRSESRIRGQIEDSQLPAPAPEQQIENETYSDKKEEKAQERVMDAESISNHEIHEPKSCGIDPAIIKTLKSEQFEGTLIATREFETRLRVIFKTCNNEVLEIYAKNTHKNLYELDEMAAELLKGSEYVHQFETFAREKLTNTKEADKYAELLKDYYEKQLAQIKGELKQSAERYRQELTQKNEEAQKVKEEYRGLLKKREAYRMETYGFTSTDMGWINIDTGTVEKNWGPQRLEIFVDNGNECDNVYTYVFYLSIKSLYRLNQEDKTLFYTGNKTDKQMLMPKKERAIAIAIGYKGEEAYLAVQEFGTNAQERLTISLKASTRAEITKAISSYDQYAEENRISDDLEYMAKFAAEEKRQKVLQQESRFMNNLYYIAFPCCIDGMTLFYNNCTSCHAVNDKIVAPALAGARSRHSMDWLIRWTRNSQQLIKSGDKEAVKIYNEYNKQVQTSFEYLTDAEIKAIFEYIDEESANEVAK